MRASRRRAAERETSAADWPPEFKKIIETLAHALRGRRPTPELLQPLMAEWAGLIPGHILTFAYLPKGVSGRSRAVYQLNLAGERISAKWNLTTRTLVDALNAACPQYPIGLS